MVEININESLTAKNDAIAKEVEKFFKNENMFCINLMGGPGSGKTTLIEGLLEFLPSLLVIQGDLKSDVDTKRLQEKGIESYQINTHSGCHLNANMIKDILPKMKKSKAKYIIIENVGNLVCPAGVLLGQNMNLVVSAITEGNDKPEKYPLIFKDSDAVILSKYDLKEALEFNEGEYLQRLQNVTTKPLFKVSSKHKDSYKKLADFILKKIP